MKTDVATLSEAVEKFKSTVIALSEIEKISEKTKSTAESLMLTKTVISENIGEIIQSANQIESHTVGIVESNRVLKEEVINSMESSKSIILEKSDSSVSQIKEYAYATFDKIQNSNEKLNKDVVLNLDKLSEHVIKYTLDAQKSIDELRIQDINSSREIREKISEINDRLFSKLESLDKSIDSQAKAFDDYRMKQTKDRKVIIFILIASALAAVASIIGLFL